MYLVYTQQKDLSTVVDCSVRTFHLTIVVIVDFEACYMYLTDVLGVMTELAMTTRFVCVEIVGHELVRIFIDMILCHTKPRSTLLPCFLSMRSNTNQYPIRSLS